MASLLRQLLLMHKNMSSTDRTSSSAVEALSTILRATGVKPPNRQRLSSKKKGVASTGLPAKTDTPCALTRASLMQGRAVFIVTAVPLFVVRDSRLPAARRERAL